MPQPRDLTLTFDNGPEPDVTPHVLDVLRERNIRATFFVIGAKLEPVGARAIAARAQKEGHWIGNHTWSHSVPFGLHPDPQFAVAEIAKAQAAIGNLAHARRYFRPYGEGGRIGPHLLSRGALDFLVEQQMTCVLWNAIPRDWEDPDGWVDRALAQMLTQPWTLMVLHDLPTGAMLHLDTFLGKAAEAGVRFRQDFPGACMPVVMGKVLGPVDEYVTG